jgi:leucyl aminopeptidase
MRFEAFSRRAAEQRCDCLVIGAFERAELGPEALAVDRAMRGRVRALLARGDFSGRAGETQLISEVTGLRSARLLLVGLGNKAQFSRRAWRRALASAIAALARTRIVSAALALERPAARELDDYYFGRAIAEVTGSSLYRINDLKSARKPRPASLARVLCGPVSAAAVATARRGLAAGAALIESSRLLRNLGNLPANVCTPRYLAAQARELERSYRRRLRVRIFDEAGIRRLKMGCLLAVTRGSAEPARFIVLEYRGGRRGRAPLVLVGKGVTFDTGGISLKDPPAMDEMKFDMSGGAAVLGTLRAVAAMKLPINVVAIVAAAENMPSGTAVKPADIVTTMSGQTVEILNTDAEGRLVLCDAITYSRRFKPAAVVDVATLTGACIVALGNHVSGLMSNTPALAQELEAAGLRADDRAWRLPIGEEYVDQLKSNFADIANVGGREGGACTAASFLGKFAKDLAWAHLDVAGTAWLSGAQKSSTGRPVPLLLDFLIHRAKAS